MRHDEKWFGKYSDEERGQAVLDVLDSARHKEEFKKIMEALQLSDEDVDREIVQINNLISYNQTPRYNQIKIRFNYVEL